ncbi:uncharacterized protein LOC124998379 [Mugil cephalus]|uniref:uncharacterized protein LOC124998379 n=1 Tax=Mugil cephalus TaxID=48193 RepID=UPI001FB65876|nr:uncharacterized protein LOC124998379 [Mugil cephalus]
MATADELLDQIWSWIKKREDCADQLKKLARELESLSEKCTAGKCVGNTVAVVGAACLIGAGVATLFTGGAAAPLLGFAGSLYSGVGATISLSTAAIEYFLSSDTMKEKEKIDKKSKQIAEKIQQLFKKLKDEIKKKNPDLEEVDQHIVTEILKAMARRSGLTINFNYCNDKLQFFHNGQITKPLDKFVHCMMAKGFNMMSGMSLIFAMDFCGNGGKLYFDEGVKQFIKVIPKEILLKGCAQVAGGAVGMMFALPDAVDNWKKMIEKNHVTEASQSMRDEADKILKMTQVLREQLNNAEKALQDMAVRQREYEEELSRKSHTQHNHTNHNMSTNLTQREIRVISKCLRLMVRSHQSANRPSKKKVAVDSQECQKRVHRQTGHHTEKSNSNRNRHRSAQSGGGDGGDQNGGGDRGDKEYGRSDEESDDDTDSDSEEESEYDESSDEATTVEIALLNVRSLNNKRQRICNLIRENNLDIFLPTETWLTRDNANEILSEISPSNFDSHYQVRGSRGGGVAILYSHEFQGVQIYFDFITTFEYVAAVVQHSEWDQPVLFINVYYPTRNRHFKTFLKEFQRLMNETQWYSSIIVTGDFNIWVDDENQRSTQKFKAVLWDAGLHQHVSCPTHRRGHTLDLIITRNMEVSNFIIRNDEISDHYTLYFTGRPALKRMKRKTKAKKYRDEQDKQLRKKEE